LLGYGLLAGIGFTMSLFIAMVAFDDAASVNAAKRGIIVGSFLAAVAAAVMLRTGRALRDAK
jgi:NhaA family Na+:H+ antiporter